MKSNKGITLIALVITIIVMLILVGVTISLITDGGLIDQAKIAENKTKKAAENESLFIDTDISNAVNNAVPNNPAASE